MISGKELPNLPFQVLLSGVLEIQSPKTDDLLFIGKLSYAPNAEGLSWFLKAVWPVLSDRVPQRSLTVVSPVPPSGALAKQLATSKGVTLLLDVPTIQEVYLQHGLCIVPIFSGGGSNIKLAEALVLGRSVLSSSFGARGFTCHEAKGVLQIADNSSDWISAIQYFPPWNPDVWKEVRDKFSLKEWNNSFLQILDHA
jgi:hypothetical protein